jgi:PIN domain nuclease of toxin-antitoxin system
MGPLARSSCIPRQLTKVRFRALPISLEHAERAGQLAIQHRDPFDRMLIAQALAEEMWFVSNEDFFDRAGVRRYW